MSDPDRWKPKPPGSLPSPVDEDARVRVAVRWYRLIGPVALAVALSRTWLEPFEEVGGTYWWIVWDLVFLAVTLIAWELIVHKEGMGMGDVKLAGPLAL